MSTSTFIRSRDKFQATSNNRESSVSSASLMVKTTELPTDSFSFLCYFLWNFSIFSFNLKILLPSISFSYVQLNESSLLADAWLSHKFSLLKTSTLPSWSLQQQEKQENYLKQEKNVLKTNKNRKISPLFTFFCVHHFRTFFYVLWCLYELNVWCDTLPYDEKKLKCTFISFSVPLVAGADFFSFLSTHHNVWCVLVIISVQFHERNKKNLRSIAFSGSQRTIHNSKQHTNGFGFAFHSPLASTWNSLTFILPATLPDDESVPQLSGKYFKFTSIG